MPETSSAISSTVTTPPEAHMALERARVLDRPECARALAGVLELRHLWIQRVNVAPFFTLGAASYLDADPSPEPYRELPVKVERMIHFVPPHIEKVRAKVPELLNEVDVVLGNLDTSTGKVWIASNKNQVMFFLMTKSQRSQKASATLKRSCGWLLA